MWGYNLDIALPGVGLHVVVALPGVGYDLDVALPSVGLHVVAALPGVR